MIKIKELFTSWRVWVLLFLIIASYAAINPRFKASGLTISQVDFNSSAYLNGVPDNVRITELNGKTVNNIQDFNAIAAGIKPGDLVKITALQKPFAFRAIEKDNQTYLGVTVEPLPTSNLKKGLDLVGGVRVLLKPKEAVSQEQFADLVDITQKRLNVFGLKDISVKQVSDLEGNKFLLVEMAGTTQQEAIKLISQQGKFEAKIGNESAFVGSEIKQVSRSAQQGAGVQRCAQGEDWTCRFMFPVTITPEAARRHADITSRLAVTTNVGEESYLEKKLDLYVDDELVDSLYISSSLKGQEATEFTIQGSGGGSTRDAAFNSALDNMKRLQTILITGSLPVKLQIEKTDVISPALGSEFLRTAIIALFAAIVAVGVIIAIRYRKPHIAIPIMLTSLSEVFIVFGVAALIKQNIDLAAIAGVLATVGTGVDAQLVITDEVLERGSQFAYDWKEKLKRALFIIMGSYATVVAAMIPLLAVGAGLLKGFAIVTIIGATIGVFVTRPAYARIIEVLLNK
ncbi:MAG: hypothetical protein HYT16_02460 [DPANN group archaeon]|nr:hypothetical protein [DPANN group archaeon]